MDGAEKKLPLAQEPLPGSLCWWFLLRRNRSRRRASFPDYSQFSTLGHPSASVHLELQERFQPFVLVLADLAKLKVRFRSSGLVCCFGEHSRSAIACGDWFFGGKVDIAPRHLK
jgi:hypothetical protein